MPDLLAPDEPTFESTDYLGKLTPVPLKGQPALPVGGPAVGSPTGPASVGGNQPTPPQPGGSGALTSGAPEGFDFSRLLGPGMKLADLAGRVLSGEVRGGALDTPSGQLTTGAPEILRDQQFGNPPDVPGGTFAGEGTAGLPATDAFSLPSFGQIGAGLGGASSLWSLAKAIQSGDPTAIANAAAQAGLAGVGIAGQVSDAVAEVLASLGGELSGGVLPGVGMALQWLMAGIDEWTGKNATAKVWQDIEDWQGKVPAMTTIMEAQPLIWQIASQGDLSKLSTEDLTSLYKIARTGVNAEEQLSTPLGVQGRQERGARHPVFPDAASAEAAGAAPSLAATMRLQDVLAQRGVKPEDLQMPGTEFWGYPGQQTQVASGEGPATMTGQSPEEWATGKSLWLDPASLYGKTGPFRTSEAPQSLADNAQWENLVAAYGGADKIPAQYLGNQPGEMPFAKPGQYLYGPDVMAQLDAIQPGQYEAGLRGLFQEAPGFAESPLARLWAQMAGVPSPEASEGVPGGDVAAQSPVLAMLLSQSATRPGGGGPGQAAEELAG